MKLFSVINRIDCTFKRKKKFEKIFSSYLKYFLKKKIFGGLYYKSYERTETVVLYGYEIGKHFYINMLFIYLSCPFASKIKLILNPIAISSY